MRSSSLASSIGHWARLDPSSSVLREKWASWPTGTIDTSKPSSTAPVSRFLAARHVRPNFHLPCWAIQLLPTSTLLHRHRIHSNPHRTHATQDVSLKFRDLMFPTACLGGTPQLSLNNQFNSYDTNDVDNVSCRLRSKYPTNLLVSG